MVKERIFYLIVLFSWFSIFCKKRFGLLDANFGKNAILVVCDLIMIFFIGVEINIKQFFPDKFSSIKCWFTRIKDSISYNLIYFVNQSIRAKRENLNRKNYILLLIYYFGSVYFGKHPNGLLTYSRIVRVIVAEDSFQKLGKISWFSGNYFV